MRHQNKFSNIHFPRQIVALSSVLSPTLPQVSDIHGENILLLKDFYLYT